MHTSNQTVDAMLAKPTSSAKQGDSSASAVSDYNKRDNSFDNVLEQQRNRHSRAQRQDGSAEHKNPPVRSGASENQQNSAVNEALGGGSEAAPSGNALPAEEETDTVLVEASGLSGALLSDPELEEVPPADEAESVLAEDPDEPEVAEHTDNQVDAGLIAAQKAGAEQQVANHEAGKPQRVAAAPAGIIAPQREARDAAIALPQAMAGQVNSGRGDNASLRETQAMAGQVNSGRGDNASLQETQAMAGQVNSGRGDNASLQETRAMAGQVNSGRGDNASLQETRAMAGQVNSGRGDNASLQETQAFKDALQQLRNGAAAPAAPAAAAAAVASTEAAGSVEHTTQNLVRVDQLLSSTQAAAAKPEVAMSTIQVPVSSPNWSQAVAQRVLWLASNGVQSAQLQLHPRELGPVDIRISVANDQTQVQFSSQYGVVRESLEASMQRLRELFDASGLQLVDVSVSDQGLSREQQSERGALATGGAQADAFEETAPLANIAAETITGAGLVDYYA